MNLSKRAARPVPVTVALVLSTLINLIPAFATTPLPPPLSPAERQNLQTKSFQIVNAKKDIPDAVKRKLSLDDMADSGKKFEAGCTSDGKTPRIRFTFAAISKTRCAVVTEHGGRGHYSLLRLFSTDEPEATLIAYVTFPREIRTLSALREALASVK